MRNSLRHILVSLALSVGHGQAAGGETQPAEPSDADALQRWFEEDTSNPVPQAAYGELEFLADYPDTDVLHSRNTLYIDAASLDSGWVRLRQCYAGLDAVPDAQVVYRYRDMRGLRIESHQRIGSVSVQGASVQMRDVETGATLCIRAQTRILQQLDEGVYVLRNGPFHRRFLDGYFPLHVTLDIHYPAASLRVSSVSPAEQPGFAVRDTPGALHIDTLFAGMLSTEIHFTAVAADSPAQ